MNTIFMMNMQAVINQQKVNDPIFDAGFLLETNSYAYKIITHLFEHGERTGGQLIKQLALKNSAMTYIRRYVSGENGMIIARKINQILTYYSINPRATKRDFGIED